MVSGYLAKQVRTEFTMPIHSVATMTLLVTVTWFVDIVIRLSKVKGSHGEHLEMFSSVAGEVPFQSANLVDSYPILRLQRDMF